MSRGDPNMSGKPLVIVKMYELVKTSYSETGYCLQTHVSMLDDSVRNVDEMDST